MDFKPKSISESLLLQKYLQGSRILVHQWTNVVWIGKLFGDVRAVKQARHTRRHETGRVAGNHRRGDEFRNDRLHAGLCEGRQDRHRDANAPDNDDDNYYNNWCDHETCRRYLVAREWNFDPAKNGGIATITLPKKVKIKYKYKYSNNKWNFGNPLPKPLQNPLALIQFKNHWYR
ncbi:hypothetical protein FRACYDRAFT_236654 [Fragilariopsis cylindrus CCMP1102]|uniref:Uncharacterized protein n=1 Tax=Fragilariopsis cylindrus CCMP1102 TaxID=635003 RepID=A0A1E7FJQ1_9STRA|nr:hypothetical protein FRACYDRAFT_236654 [Fragilariopsis cylindrus CCMP1102]|eukprot:OEU18377.1 hypothetical protein FRACYDRAFT_236654 [Fragilariopsis cylindrus CCMP1102]